MAIEFGIDDAGEKEFYIECDDCGDDDDLAADNFQDAVDEAKSKGWGARLNLNKIWENMCPECNQPPSATEVFK